MITNEYGANHLIITKSLRLGSELAFVADSGLWIGHRFALTAGNRYKGELGKRSLSLSQMGCVRRSVKLLRLAELRSCCARIEQWNHSDGTVPPCRLNMGRAELSVYHEDGLELAIRWTAGSFTCAWISCCGHLGSCLMSAYNTYN